MSFEAYSIAVRISVVNHATAGLLSLSRSFAKTEADAAKLEGRIKSIHKQLALGGAMLGAGAVGLTVIDKFYQKAKEVAQAQASFQTLNLTAQQNASAFAKAASNAHGILGTKIADNVRLIQDMVIATGDLKSALGVSADATRYAFNIHMVKPGANAESTVLNGVKALEHRGDKVFQDPIRRAQEMSRQSQVNNATAGRVDPNAYFAMSQTGKMAYTLFNPDFLYGPMVAYMQSRSGSTAGTASMTAMSSMIGGHMTSKAKGFLADIGLWSDVATPQAAALKGRFNSDPMVQKLIAANGGKLIQNGGLTGGAAQLYAQDPDAFVRTVLEPAMRKKFGDLSGEQMAMKLAQYFNRNTADFLGFFITSASKAKKDADLVRRAQDFHGAYNTYLKSPEGRETAASAAWQNFQATFGAIYLPTITKGLLSLAGTLNKLSDWVDRHPTTAKVIATGFAAIFGALALGGIVNIAAGGLRGLGLALGFKGAGGVGGIAKLTKTLFGFGKSMTLGGVGVIRSVSSALGGVTGALGALGSAAAVFAAAYAGWKVGSAIYDKAVDGTDAGTFLGAQVAATAAWLGNKEAAHALAFNRAHPHGTANASTPYVRRHGAASVQVTAPVHLDGKKIAEVVSHHQARAASRPQSGMSRFDASQHPTPIGVGGY